MISETAIKQLLIHTCMENENLDLHAWSHTERTAFLHEYHDSLHYDDQLELALDVIDASGLKLGSFRYLDGCILRELQTRIEDTVRGQLMILQGIEQ